MLRAEMLNLEGEALAIEVGRVHGEIVSTLDRVLGSTPAASMDALARKALQVFSREGTITAEEARDIGRIFDAIDGGGDFKARVRAVCDEIIRAPSSSLNAKCVAAIGRDSTNHTDE